MKKQLLVTAVGADRPGIVARLTEVFVKHGANLEDSRMAILGGEFAAIMLVSVPVDKLDTLDKSLLSLKDETIVVTTKQTEAKDPERFSKHLPYELTVTGADHEGIVHAVTRFLSERSINIQAMDTDVVNAPETAIPLFQMRAIILVPDTVNYSELQNNLSKIGANEGLDILVTTSKARSTAKAAAPTR